MTNNLSDKMLPFMAVMVSLIMIIVLYYVFVSSLSYFKMENFCKNNFKNSDVWVKDYNMEPGYFMCCEKAYNEYHEEIEGGVCATYPLDAIGKGDVTVMGNDQ